MTALPMPNADPQIRRARHADASALAEFAARIFVETFGADNHPSDLAEHLARSYGVIQQGRELADPAYITIVAEDLDDLAAFAQIRRSAAPACVKSHAPVELYRFYVDTRWHGRGLARRLMTGVHEAARELGGASIWLSVWERNPRAIAFYSKCGFSDVGATDFFVGADRQTDRVMVAPLTVRPDS
jgi:diamine N-acetyltransferase